MIRHLTYLSIDENARKVSGNRRLTQLQHTLGDRSLSEQQRKLVEEEVQRVNDWMSGSIIVEELPAADAEVVHHDVVVSESLTIVEN